MRPATSRLCPGKVATSAKRIVFLALRVYLSLSAEPGKSAGGSSPLDHLQKAAQCYASALKLSPRELQAHIGLGLAMEEFFYAEDLFGLKKEVSSKFSSRIFIAKTWVWLYIWNP